MKNNDNVSKNIYLGKKDEIKELLKDILNCQNIQSKEGKNLIKKVNEIQNKKNLCLSLRKELNYYKELNSYLQLNLTTIQKDTKDNKFDKSNVKENKLKIDELFESRKILFENVMKKYVTQIEKLKIEKNNIIEKYSPILNNKKDENKSLLELNEKQTNEINQHNEIIENINNRKKKLEEQKIKENKELKEKEENFLNKIKELEETIKNFSYFHISISNPLLEDSKLSDKILTNENLNITLREKELENQYLQSTIARLESKIELTLTKRRNSSNSQDKNLSQYFLYNNNTLKKSFSFSKKIRLKKSGLSNSVILIPHKNKNSILNLSLSKAQIPNQ